jgi:hypothetical protein
MTPLYFLTALADKIRVGIGMLLPIFRDAADLRTWPRWAKWGMHLLLLGLVLWGLYIVQHRNWLPINTNLLDRAPRDLQQFYLDLLFLTLYAICWVGYGLYRLFAEDVEVAEFPDLDRAWRAAVAGLEGVGVRLNDPDVAPPVYLVLGKPASGTDALFKAAGWNFQYRFPADPTSRLVVYACSDPYAVFVTVPDATGWAYLAAALNGDARHAPAAGSPEAADPTKTLSFGADAGGLRPLGLNPSEAYELKTLLRAKGQHELAAPEEDRLRVLAAKGNTGGGGQPFAIQAQVLRTGEREARFVAKLIRRDRWPLSPINGVMVLVPWAAGETEAVAEVAARELAVNLSAVKDVVQLHYPTFAVVCDLETARGFGHFRAAFSPDQLKQRLGQRVPLVPVRTPESPDPASLIRMGVRWIGQAVMPVWILGALRQLPPADQPPVGPDPNRELYLLLREVHRRSPGFASILSRVPAGAGDDEGDELDGLPLFGGCYLSGTGARATGQAFVTGVFKRLDEDQDCVAWTRRAYAEDRRLARWAKIGYIAIAAAVVVAVLAVRAG